MDSSKVSLQAVLLHNRNKLPSVLLVHATNMKESYENTNYFWKISRMKNMIGITLAWLAAWLHKVLLLVVWVE